MRGWDLSLPGWRWLYEPQFGVSTPCGAVSTQGITDFILILLNLSMYGTTSDTEV